MKKLFVLLFIAANILFAQVESWSAPFSNTGIGIYGGINAGFGVNYKLSSKIDLDFRYLYKTDSELIDTHQFLLGIRI